MWNFRVKGTSWHFGCTVGVKHASGLPYRMNHGHNDNPERHIVKSSALNLKILILLGLILLAAPTRAQNVDYDLHWAPSPAVGDEGVVHTEAFGYEVFVKRGAEREELIATVGDTLYTLSAEPGVVQRLMVRAFDGQGRRSAMSDPSDPIYFELEEDNRGLPEMPPTVQLGDAYPNPFNPETRVVYGVPDNLTGDESMRLDIYNVEGKLIRTLDVDPNPGWHEVQWDGKDERGVVASTGLYLTRFAVGSMVTTGKMTMVK